VHLHINQPLHLHVCAYMYSGWICYAEKTHGDFILPYISATRSPQQMMGSLVKGYFAGTQVREQLQYHLIIDDHVNIQYNPMASVWLPDVFCD